MRSGTAWCTAARLAESMFVYRIKKYVGTYFAVLDRIDAIVFTGGIGEHSARIRAQVCAGLEALGIDPDASRNARGEHEFQRSGAALRLMIIATDEELEIARSTARCLPG